MHQVPLTLLAIAAAVYTFAPAAVAATYYVSKSGNDANPCSQAQPCLTIQRGRDAARSPGDIVQVAAGTYNESVTLSTGGSASGKITFRGHDGSGCPTTAVSDVNHPTGGRPNPSVTLSGHFDIRASYVAVDCFKISYPSDSAFTLSPRLSNIDILNNNITNSGGGITFDGITTMTEPSYTRSVLISRNYIHDNRGGMFILCSNCTITDNEITALSAPGGGSDLDYIDVWGLNTVIRHNYMHGNTINACYSWDCHMDCIQTWNTTGDGTEVSKNITFDRNVCFNHHEGVIIQDLAGNGDVANWTVTNNVFAFGPWDDGSGHQGVAGTVHPWCWVFERGNLGTNVFHNNTCINGSVGFRDASGTASFKNNIYYNPQGGSVEFLSGGASGANNLFYGSGAHFSGDFNSSSMPFVSMGSSTQKCVGCDFRLNATSAAIDRGATISGVTVDLTGVTRPKGAAYDVGAYEYGTGSTSPLPPSALSALVQ